MIAVPGDLVFLQVMMTGSTPCTFAKNGRVLALLLSRVTDDALHEDDGYDICLLLPIGETKLRRDKGMFVKRLETVA